MSNLEGRYRRLLRAYPASYRADRADEMLGTLLETSRPDQRWPAAREVRTLTLGGLRTRAWRGQRLPLATSLRQALLFAAVIDLMQWGTLSWRMVAEGLPLTAPLLHISLTLLTLAAAAGAFFWPRKIAVAIAVAAAALWITHLPINDDFTPVLALAAIAILVSRWERLPKSLLGPAALAFIALVTPNLTDWAPLIVLPVAVAVAAILWSVVDARPLTALGLWVTAEFSAELIQEVGQSYFGWIAPAGLLIALSLAASGVWLVRRQAVL